jgi:cyclic pyranopterin phosphate synthase
VYCVSGKETTVAGKAAPADRLADYISAIHRLSGIEVVRLTGGEPTLYKQLIPFINKIKPLGIDIKMTTNAYILYPMLNELADAGLTHINISLDAIEEDVFFRMSRRKNLTKIIAAIDKAIALKFKVKLNAVIVKGFNEDQVLPLYQFAKERNVPIRYLELMRMGHLFSNQFDEYFFPQQQILNKISATMTLSEVERVKSSTASSWIDEDGYSFGIIANETDPFCHDCNRLRIDSSGNIYGCLSSNLGFPIEEIVHDQEALRETMMKALMQKQPLKFTGSHLSMLNVGG